jgi:uncharacterized protein
MPVAAVSVFGLVLILAFLALALLAIYSIYAAWRIYRPDRPKVERSPSSFGLPCEPLSFSAADQKVILAGWLIPASNASSRRGHTIVLCHQWGAHKGFSLPYVKFYHEAGFDVIAFDLRNHGDSGYDSGFRLMSRRFTDDVHGAVAAASTHSTLQGNRISLHAFSFSTFPAVVAALDNKLQFIDSIVLDSGPTFYTEDIIYGFFDTIGVKLLPTPLRVPIIYPVFRAFFVIAVQFMLTTDWPSPRLKKTRVPALLITGEVDQVARPADVKRVADLLPAGTLMVVPGAKHLGSLRSAPELYIRTVLAFHDKLAERLALTIPE